MTESEIIVSVRKWVERIVIGLDLCPFAGRELMNDRVRFTVTDATSEEELLMALHDELHFLKEHEGVETTLVIIPKFLKNFFAFNDFLAPAEDLIEQLHMDGVFQIASFHPSYQFEGTSDEDVENYTNRSPYPIVHLLREESVEHAIATHPDVHSIPDRNQDLMRSLGINHMKSLLKSSLSE